MTAPTATPTEPPTMPHPNADADFASAAQAQETYKAAVVATRADPRLTELTRAEAISAAYATYSSDLEAAGERLQSRRQARYNWLAAQLPTGPGVPEGTTPADGTVLVAAFRNHYERAKAMTQAERAQMLDEADRFGDEPARRAALTAILENGETNTLAARPDRHGLLAARVAEMTELDYPSSTVRRFEMLAFTRERKPNEAIQLPHLQQRQAQQEAAAQQQRAVRF
ncbi:hypothetical protein ACVDFE_07845 [Lentzea chajnantorensis]